MTNLCFPTVMLRRLLRVPWTARRSNQSILKKISPEYSLEGLMLKLKLQCLATWCEEPTHWKRLWCWKALRTGGKGATEDEMVGWQHQLDGHELEQAPGVGDVQGGLECCSPWSCKESDTTERLNWTEPNHLKWTESCSVMSDSLQHHGLYSPWNSPGQTTGMGSLSLL